MAEDKAAKFTMPPLSRVAAVITERIRNRIELVVVAAGLIAAMMIGMALSWTAGILAFASILGYALLREPASPEARALRQRRSRPDLDQAIARQTLIDAMPDPAWVLDGHSIVLNANALARGIFPNLRTGIHVSSAARSPDVIEAIEKTVATGVVQSATLHQRVPVERRLVVVVAPLYLSGAQDSDPALLLTVRDLTEQDRLAEMRADFVANASHELRTPLASLRGFVETLQGPARNDPAARERFLAIMSTQADRMTRLIDDLLSLSRIEMRQHLTPTETVDLCDVIAQVIQGLEPQAAHAKVVLAFKPEPALVRGDRDELAQVFQNLIQNAIKYGREGGHVHVDMQRRKPAASRLERIEVAVKDDGPGIAAQHIPRLTERFYRVNTSQSRDKGGTGLGLAIVKHIVTRHGGDLAIASKVGEGSTFTVAFDNIEKSIII